MTKNQRELERMYDEYYPNDGVKKSLAAEILEAAMDIGYYAWKYGDIIGAGYGKETCNPSARFLMSNTTEEIADLIIAIWGLGNGGAYCALLDVIIGKVIEYVKANPSLRDAETDGIMSCYDPIEDTNEYELTDAAYGFDEDDDLPVSADEILKALKSNYSAPSEDAYKELLEVDKRICMDEGVQG